MSWLFGMSQAFIDCRRLGHNWDEGHYSQFSVVIGEVGEVLRCTRCSSERADIFDRDTGQLVSRRYTKPEGYAKPAGEPRAFVADYRLEIARRKPPKHRIPTKIGTAMESFFKD